MWSGHKKEGNHMPLNCDLDIKLAQDGNRFCTLAK